MQHAAIGTNADLADIAVGNGQVLAWRFGILLLVARHNASLFKVGTGWRPLADAWWESNLSINENHSHLQDMLASPAAE
jgi:hypothetical protein